MFLEAVPVKATFMTMGWLGFLPDPAACAGPTWNDGAFASVSCSMYQMGWLGSCVIMLPGLDNVFKVAGSQRTFLLETVIFP